MRLHLRNAAILALAINGLVSQVARADTSPSDLTAQWWQWAVSIPASVNPTLDPNGANCMVGQRGDTWFLAGSFFGVQPVVTRSCTIPLGVTIFVPVANQLNVDAPNSCGQGASIPLAQLRQLSTDFVNGVTALSASLDGKPLTNFLRLQSPVFSVAFPQDNAFLPFCPSRTTLLPGIYSPAVDAGYYLMFDSLSAGSHVLKFHAENAAAGFSTDVTYHLTVVRPKK